MFKPIIYLCLCLCSCVHATCLSPVQINQLVSGYPNSPVSGLHQIETLADAYCTQEQYVELLQNRLGDIVGYKVGFTSQAGQQRFQIASPATAVLLEKMFVASGNRVSLDFGYRTLIEPDFMVVIADDGIMQATSARETLKYVASIHPFIELVAMQLAPDEPVTGNSLVAINIAATKAIVGQGIEVQDNEGFYQQIANIKTIFIDDNEQVIQETNTQALMGHPLEVLYWLLNDFKQRGLSLKAGDKVSLGATGKLYPIAAGPKTYHYYFAGLTDEPVSASVTLVP